MPRLKLTAPFCDNPPIPAQRSIVFWDEDPKGFGISVTSNGHKAYIFNYRHQGKLRRLHFKDGLTLAKARQQARILQGQVATGRDPLGERRKEEIAQGTTLRAVVDEYFRLEGDELRTRDLREQAIKRHILPSLGKRQIHEIERLEVARLIERIRDTAGPSAARHAFAYLRVVFNWFSDRSNTFNSPLTRGMTRKIKARKRQRILTDDEICRLWQTTQANPTLFGHYCLFLLLTCTRRCEASGIRRSEISGTNWIVPESRYKTGFPLLVPLNSLAVDVLNAVPRIGRNDLVFTTNGRAPIAGFSTFKRDFDAACKVYGWTLHDLRRTGRTLMSRAGVVPDIGERCIGHLISGVRGIYDVYEYADEKRQAFDRLAGEIDRIVHPPASSNVHQLRPPRQA